MTPELRGPLTAELLPPNDVLPQETTEPSALSAAKAYSVAKILLTPELSKLATEELLPPALELPQLMTEPSALSAAKA